MAESQNKTEQPTDRRLGEAALRGQFARSADLNTAAALVAAALTLSWFGRGVWNDLTRSVSDGLMQTHRSPLTDGDVPAMASAFIGRTAMIATPALAMGWILGLVASLIQSRGRLATKQLVPDLDRLDWSRGWKNLFNASAWVKAVVNLAKLGLMVWLGWSGVSDLMDHPVFHVPTSFADFLGFLAAAVRTTLWRILLGFSVIMVADYAYQLWRTREELKMSREEVKEEMKSTEGDQFLKGEARRRRQTMRKSWLLTVPTADVVVVNPTHIAVALKYDFQEMSAPVVVAKGIRLNAQRIREIATQFGVPIVENKPVARLLFQTCREGAVIDPRLFQAVAEILAFVYRTNRYRYYALKNRVDHGKNR
jgi:flagellar biosynthetic protein FlhB